MSGSNHNCFKGSYFEARQCLLAAIAGIDASLVQQHHAVRHPLPGPDSQPVFLDWIRFGQNETPDNVLVLISGTHGVEGFAGSGVQCGLLEPLLDALQWDNALGIILVHALNPWGFSWLRRYDHEGIDLNRNFVNFGEPLPKNHSYNAIHKDLFGASSGQPEACLTRWHTELGKEQFEEAITRGQYQHSDGLFYGGTAPCWSREVLEQFSNNASLRRARRIAVIDLHTGLGPYGHGEVINDHEPETPGFSRAVTWYGGNTRSVLLGESYSPPKTGLLDFFWHRLVGDRGCFVTLEFGTYALDRLLLTLCEEQRYHNSYGGNWQGRDIHHPSVIALRDFFYPPDDKWRHQILNRAWTIIQLALQGISR